jgi:Leucine-rich repeat (LRR) protein
MEGNNLPQPWHSLYDADPMLLVYLHSPTLDSLDISACGLTELPASLTAMHSLKSLNISQNLLVTLPRALGELPSLEALCVDGNPLAPHLSTMLAKVRDALQAVF